MDEAERSRTPRTLTGVDPRATIAAAAERVRVARLRKEHAFAEAARLGDDAAEAAAARLVRAGAALDASRAKKRKCAEQRVVGQQGSVTMERQQGALQRLWKQGAADAPPAAHVPPPPPPPPTPPPPPPVVVVPEAEAVFAQGAAVLYKDWRAGGTLREATVLTVHHNDTPPYYTVRFCGGGHGDGETRETVRERLRPRTPPTGAA